MAITLTEDEFAEAVTESLQLLPDDFQRHMTDLAVDVEDLPDRQTLTELGIKDQRGLLGLYRGLPLTKRSVGHMLRIPERIVLYQRNIERICRSRRDVIEQIRRTVLHEVGHHFGMDEHRLRELGY
jgi:predicted Zn-dependent protease with MMP-like domain